MWFSRATEQERDQKSTEAIYMAAAYSRATRRLRTERRMVVWYRVWHAFLHAY